MVTSLHDLRLLVIAHDPLARAGLAAILAVIPGCQVVGQAAANADWPSEIGVAQPDVVVWDLGWAAEEAVSRLAELTESAPPILALLADHETGWAARVWQAGVRGILARTADPAAIVAAAQGLAQGLVALDRESAGELVLASLVDQSPGSLVETLTPRETEVLQLMAEGMTNRAIARRLEISEHTAKFHVNAILGKLGAQSRTEAVMRATRAGLILL